MRIEVLHFDDCPNWQTLTELLSEAFRLVEVEAAIEFVKVDTPELAEQWRFRGSPTLLVDGEDPFLDENAPVGLSCRLYRTSVGFQGTPTLEQLVVVLTPAG